MKFLSFKTPNKVESFGIVVQNGVIDLGARVSNTPDLRALIESGNAIAEASKFLSEKPDWTLDQLELLPVITNPRTIACVGHNYEDHRVETQRDPTQFPSIFTRTAESLQGAGQAMLIPRESEQFDYEGELAVVIGKGGRRIAEADAWAHVFGYSCFNEGSVRDWQHHSRQFIPGKNFPKTGAFGPFLVTSDEADPAKGLMLTTRLNGNIVQQSSTQNMIFSIPVIIAYVSTFITLQPGDVIVSGTPGGVGAKRVPPLWMRDGDTVEVEIENVGLLVNKVSKEK